MRGLVRTEAVSFCSDCGALSHDAPERVCTECGMGIVLSCAPGLLPRPGAAFLVVKSDMRISAASAAVDSLLGDPDSLVGEPLLELLSGEPGLRRAVARAAMGSQRVTNMVLRVGASRINARVGACGDPPAALVVLL
jgi:hypothetical protein